MPVMKWPLAASPPGARYQKWSGDLVVLEQCACGGRAAAGVVVVAVERLSSLPLEMFSPKEMTFTNRSKPDADEKLSDHNTSPDAGNDINGVAAGRSGVGGGTAPV